MCGGGGSGGGGLKVRYGVANTHREKERERDPPTKTKNSEAAYRCLKDLQVAFRSSFALPAIASEKTESSFLCRLGLCAISGLVLSANFTAT